MAHYQGREARYNGLIFGSWRLTGGAALHRCSIARKVRRGRLKLAPVDNAAQPICEYDYDELVLLPGTGKHTQLVYRTMDIAEGKGVIFDVATCRLEEPHLALLMVHHEALAHGRVVRDGGAV